MDKMTLKMIYALHSVIWIWVVIKTTTGYMVKSGSGIISWSSKLQSIVTLSTTEAEYVAATASGKEIYWVQNLLKEISYMPPVPTKLFIDNQFAISVAKNPKHHGRKKHLDLCYYWLREKVAHNVMTPIHLPADEMPADLVTKPLAKPKVELFRSIMGLGY